MIKYIIVDKIDFQHFEVTQIDLKAIQNKHVNYRQKMSMFLIGKLLIAVGICLQAYILCKDQNEITTFDNQLNAFLKRCEDIPPDVGKLLKQYLRFIIIGFLSCSGLMVFFRTGLLKFAVLIGFILHYVVLFQPRITTLSFKNRSFWYNLSMIGGMIYLLGAEPCSHPKRQHQQSNQKAQSKKPPSKDKKIK